MMEEAMVCVAGRDAGPRLSVSETSGSTARTHRPGGDTPAIGHYTSGSMVNNVTFTMYQVNIFSICLLFAEMSVSQKGSYHQLLF